MGVRKARREKIRWLQQYPLTWVNCGRGILANSVLARSLGFEPSCRCKLNYAMGAS